MSEYSTGELANLFCLSKRTIQFYDKKGILKPAYIKHNKYRVYKYKEVQKVKIVQMLKNMGFSLKDISELLNYDKDMKSVTLLLQRKINTTEDIIKKDQQNLKYMQDVQNMISEESNSQIQKLLDIEHAMEKNNEYKKLHKKLFIIGGLGTFVQLLGISISFAINSYIPFLISFIFGVVCAIIISKKYFNSVVYMCPNCHNQFKPKLFNWTFAAHTPKTRKLKCPQCKEKSHCVEILSV